MPDLRSLYDNGYYHSNYCEGSVQFMNGRRLSPLKTRQVARLAPAPGRRVLDAGCGRGEVLLACAEAGAEIAGIDFSPHAIEITRATLGGHDADLREGEVTRLPWPDASFDAALSGDVIEHLHRREALQMLSELRRVLRPGGHLVLHTAPNRLFLDVTWPVLRQPMRLRWPETVATLDQWIAESKRFHFNEQTLHGLRRDLRRAGFAEPRVWIDANLIRGGTHHLTEGLETSRAVALGTRLTRLRLVRLFAGNDLWAIACK